MSVKLPMTIFKEAVAADVVARLFNSGKSYYSQCDLDNVLALLDNTGINYKGRDDYRALNALHMREWASLCTELQAMMQTNMKILLTDVSNGDF